jgi:hypothetical protein
MTSPLDCDLNFTISKWGSLLSITECGWIAKVNNSAEGGSTIAGMTSRATCLSYCQGFDSCGAAAWTESSKTCKVAKKPVTSKSEDGTILFEASCECPQTTVAPTAAPLVNNVIENSGDIGSRRTLGETNILICCYYSVNFM